MKLGNNGAIIVKLQIPPQPEGPKPAILANLSEGDEMLNAGAVVVTYSILWHFLKGPRPTGTPSEQTVGKWVLASPDGHFLGQNYLTNLVDTATEVIPTIVDYLETVPEIDAKRIAISGGSTNGFIALRAVASDRRFRAAVVVAACGDLHEFLRQSSLGMEGRPLDLDPEYSRWVSSNAVVSQPGSVVPTALLMVNRVGDEVIPVTCADSTAKALGRAYKRAGVADRFRYDRIDDPGHGLGPKEAALTSEWLRRWLFPAP